MSYELISDQDYNNLPDDNGDCFVQFEAICRRNMMQLLSANSSGDFEEAVKALYVSSVAAVAEECDIPNINYNSDHSNFSIMYNKFSLSVQGEIASIKIRQRGERRLYSVLLTSNVRTKIEHHIERIREAVKNSNMEQRKKEKLQKKLNELLKEVESQRLNFSTTMAVLVAITTTIAGVTTIAADGKNAIANIMQLIGQDKQTEDEAAKRLAAPPKALPPPRKQDLSSPSLPEHKHGYDLGNNV